MMNTTFKLCFKHQHYQVCVLSNENCLVWFGKSGLLLYFRTILSYRYRGKLLPAGAFFCSNGRILRLYYIYIFIGYAKYDAVSTPLLL